MQGNRGPAVYYGYCHRSQRYRMMDLPDFVSNTQEGMANIASNNLSPYQTAMSAGGVATAPAGVGTAANPWERHHHHHGDCGCGCGGKQEDCGCGGKHEHHHHDRDCGCHDRHCECCVSDADVLVHARCGEVRRIPLTFENDTRRDKPITLELGKFLTHGGKDLGWLSALSETQFTLHPCDEHTVSLLVNIRCKTDDTNNPTPTPAPGQTTSSTPADTKNVNANATPAANTISTNARLSDIGLGDRFGDVDRCEVGYATIRAEGCLTRPIVVAIAVLPEDCDAFRHPCGCSCCC